MKNLFVNSGRAFATLSDKLDARVEMKTIVCKSVGNETVCEIVKSNPQCVLIEDSLFNECIGELIDRFRWKNYGFGKALLEGEQNGLRAKPRAVFAFYDGSIDKAKIERLFEKTLSENEFVELLRAALLDPARQSPASRIKEFFTKIGLYRNLSGYDYLLQAAEEVCENASLIKSLTKELYPRVGMRFGASATIVERNIRNAINSVYSSGKLREVINGQYGGNLDKYEKPTNGEMIAFLAQIAEY